MSPLSRLRAAKGPKPCNVKFRRAGPIRYSSFYISAGTVCKINNDFPDFKVYLPNLRRHPHIIPRRAVTGAPRFSCIPARAPFGERGYRNGKMAVNTNHIPARTSEIRTFHRKSGPRRDPIGPGPGPCRANQPCAIPREPDEELGSSLNSTHS